LEGTGKGSAVSVVDRLCAMLGIRYPVVQDGMGPFRTGRLAAAVSGAGGLGTVSIPGMTVDPAEGARLLRRQIEEATGLTDGPVAVNVPVGFASTGDVLPVTEAYIAEAIAVRSEGGKAGRQLVAVTTSAGFAGSYSARLHEVGLVHMHKVGALRHARKAADAGADVVIASGYEMGGHTHEHPVHTMVLAAQVIPALQIPVLVSGGIFDGRGLAAALAMGAAGVAMGTRFIATEENDWHEAYKQRIVAATEWSDVVFPGVYGPARGLDSAGVRRLQAMVDAGETSESELTRWKDEAMIRAQRDGDVDEGLLPAGQCAGAISGIVPVGRLVPEMVEQARALLAAAHDVLPDPRRTPAADRAS
jgi:NAD(P)H-dependent flavin oxidoreductase YrpB (nitropropane dioxygenase family)